MSVHEVDSSSFEGHYVTVSPEPMQTHRDAVQPLGNASSEVRANRVAEYRQEIARMIREELTSLGLAHVLANEEGTIHAVPVDSAQDLHALHARLQEVFPKDMFLVGEWSVGARAVDELDTKPEAALEEGADTEPEPQTTDSPQLTEVST